MTTALKTYVYVDGFNLYYGCLKGTRYKWLNIPQLCEKILPKNKIEKVYYFTARTKPRRDDPHTNTRQLAFIRALETDPRVMVVYGQFRSHNVYMPLVNPVGKRKFAEVIKTEEKGSDVNLASFLLNDAFRGNFEVGVVLSNDSDLVMPIKIAKKVLGQCIGLICPVPRATAQLKKETSFVRPIRTGLLSACQYSTTMTDKKGAFHKPATW